MTNKITGHKPDIQQTAASFAAEQIAGREFNDFPSEIWHQMGTIGLLGAGLSDKWGGTNGTTPEIFSIAEALAMHGRNFGMAFSMLIHIVVSRIVMDRHSTPAQKQKYLPELASGRQTASLAISEPGRGNHPKNLLTEAFFSDGFWHISGEKIYLTNGIFADLFIVMAVTGIKNNIKEYTAFIVPADTPGLTRTRPIPLNVFKPSPHCGIKLDKCKVPDANILGEKGRGYTSIAIPFRDAEDLLLMGPILGSMATQLKIITETINNNNISLNHEKKAELGLIRSFIHAMRTLCLDAAAMMDREHDPDELTSLVLALNTMSGQHLDRVDKFFKEAGLEENTHWKSIMDDLRFAVRLAESIRTVKAGKQADIMLNKRLKT
jgi:acyl-CoA dehydrogenase